MRGMPSLRHQALRLLRITDPDTKARETRALDTTAPLGIPESIVELPGIPGRPAKPELHANLQTKKKSLTTAEGRAVLLHALAHIELNAIDLALDIVWRFAGMPEAFYRQWLQVAQEEALHFELLRNHLHSLGYGYGDFPAHNGLWDMAAKTQHDLLARLALVPRTLEARGLDASPAVKAKLISVGDMAAGEILDIILRDEIGHVAIGNHWYNYLCQQQGRDPISTYTALAAQYDAPRPRPPLNMEARRKAGFSEAELLVLEKQTVL
jgi:uncharacterized ferritin-like protein (DUF455 family)